MWFDPIIKWTINSPFHFFISGNMMLITFTGRKSGKTYTTPVNYFAAEDANGPYYATTSLAQRKWWRNLRGGAPVTVRIKGRDYRARAEAFESQEQVARGLLEFIQKNPKYAGYFQLTINENGQPNPAEAFDRAAGKVLIKTRVQ